MAAVVALLMIAGGLTPPGAVGSLLVASALAAGVACLYGARRATSVDRHGWTLLGIGQLLSAGGNLAVLVWADGSFDDLGWVTTITFTTATLATVIGLFAFVIPGSIAPGRRGRHRHRDRPRLCVRTRPGLEGRASGQRRDPRCHLPAVGRGPRAGPRHHGSHDRGLPFSQSRPSGERLAIRLAAVSLAVATLGDSGATTARLTQDVTAVTWLVASAIVLVAACAIPRQATLVWSLPRDRSLDFATVLSGVTVATLLLSERPVDSVAKVVSGVTILVVLVRQLMMSHNNATLGRKP